MKKSKYVAVLDDDKIFRYKGKHYGVSDGDKLTSLPEGLIKALENSGQAKNIGGKEDGE